MSLVTRRGLLLALLVTAWVLSGPGAAWAGCGCDHPPPNWAPVMPPFASPGKTVRIHPDGYELVAGTVYQVGTASSDLSVEVVAGEGYLDVEMPSGIPPGPVAIRVQGPGVDHTYGPEHFTALSPAPVVPASDGVYAIPGFEVSITHDGTLLLPFNLSEVLDPTQFAFALGGLRLAYGHDDVVFYNEDGIDLTLFTLDVEDPTAREWGSYYGWNVEQDTGIRGDVFQNKVQQSLSLWFLSDALTYWRHEFHTYHQAHLPGGTHELDQEGFHKDLGTRHIDHDHLVLAISGKERSFWAPLDMSKASDLEPGSRVVNVYAAAVRTPNPVEPEVMDAALEQSIYGGTTLDPMVLESPSTYDDDDDSDSDD